MNNLKELVDSLSIKQVQGFLPEQLQCTDIQVDSKKVVPGSIFVAYKGVREDGHEYIPHAVDRGAVAVVAEQSLGSQLPVPLVIVPNSRQALSRLAAAYWDFPAKRMRVIGVTGTDGKTTTSTLIYNIFAKAGFKVGLLSTIRAVIAGVGEDIGVHVTTPTSLDMQRYLSQMANAGTEVAIVEVTSHGLDQFRVEDCYFDTAVLTNITREHLDYHGTFENYVEAKSRLFDITANQTGKPYPKVGVLNSDDPSFKKLKVRLAIKLLSYGMSNTSDFFAENVSMDLDGSTFTLSYRDAAKVETRIPLLGLHNIHNAMAAIAAGVANGISLQDCVEGVRSSPVIPARLENIDLGQDFRVFLDYAHTPNGLEKVLATLRPLAHKNLLLVFGLSGGPRDRSKRPSMGRVAGRYADKILVTAVDWYEDQEPVDLILENIAQGLQETEARDYRLIPVRQEAIRIAIQEARPGDIVLIAGKGHENKLNVGTKEIDWDEKEIIENAIKERLASGSS
jgi:UDP-N-acetylmuramoyl-L-alanyl-D-glutamate--2,6-diaminopimelate ligase